MDYYNILNLNKDASIDEIKESYKKLIKKYHPDKNNDINSSNKFIQIQEAYKNLIKQKTSNKYYNIFSDLYNEGIFDKYVNLLFNKVIYNHIDQNKILCISCNLEEFYNSCIKTIRYKRKISVSPVNSYYEEKILNLNINSFNYHNQKIIYYNCGDENKYNKKNDLILIIKEEEHKLFKREEFNLITKIDITLKESLCKNTLIKIPLLNNEYYNFKLDKIIKPSHTEIIKNLGMPKSDSKNGDLILKFNIIFPNNLTDTQIYSIKNIL